MIAQEIPNICVIAYKAINMNQLNQKSQLSIMMELVAGKILRLIANVKVVCLLNPQMYM